MKNFIKIFTIETKMTPCNITFELLGMHSQNITTNVNIDIKEQTVTKFSYNGNIKYGNDLYLYNNNSNIIEFWIEKSINDNFIINNLSYNINECFISFNYDTVYEQTNKNLIKCIFEHTHDYAKSSTPGGPADSALKLTTSRNIALSGDISGNANFNGDSNITINSKISTISIDTIQSLF